MLSSAEVVSSKISSNLNRPHTLNVTWLAGVLVYLAQPDSVTDLKGFQSREEEVDVVVPAPSPALKAQERAIKVQEMVTCFANCLCCKLGELKIVAQLDAGSYAPGDTLQVFYGVSNHSRVDCIEVLIEIRQHCSWRAGEHTGGDEQLVASVTGSGARSGCSFGCSEESKPLVGEVVLPTDGPLVPSLSCGSTVVSHFALLRARTTGTCVFRKPELRIPFTLFRQQHPSLTCPNL
mmetsp:Transcript_110698/g.202921  ORF Transcript_110698/g.202921 Transcript_110698/m.202921 type:complete len:235 (+) Transcript_110698:175-879(+)